MKGITNIAGFILLWTLLCVVSLGVGLIPLAILLLATHSGGEGRRAKASALLAGTLMPGETLEAEALQHRAFALATRRLLVAITSSRIMLLRRGLIGGFKMQDIQWKDLTDARIEQNVWASLTGSNLMFEHANANVPAMSIDGVPSAVASTIYSNAQFQEQAWEEKRRVRGLEETRAAAGGVTVHSAPAQPIAATPAPAPAATPVSSSNHMLEQIAKAKELLDMGAVSDAEFQEMKAKILSAA